MRISSVLFALSMIGCDPMTPAARAPAVAYDHQGPPPSSRILISTQQTCPATANGCDILEVIDLHTSAKSEDKGFDELRAKAAAEGGDAVIGAEFEHGDGAEPSHLSGMIVRYGNPIPPHVVLGEIDIPSDENSSDKGMAAMSARRIEMGGDQVIGVTFEHGDDGQQGHLRGKVIRYTR
jgi:uncharacterized protein YbjQ (UPF0145 family)